MSVSEREEPVHESETASGTAPQTPTEGDDSPVAERRVRSAALAGAAVVAVTVVAVAVWWIGAPAQSEPPAPKPVTRGEVERIAARLLDDRIEALRTERAASDERLSDVAEQVNERDATIEGLDGRLDKMARTVDTLRAAKPWRAALERAREDWGDERGNLSRRLDNLERRVRAHSDDPPHRQADRRGAEAASAPAFRVTGIEYWGPAVYATLADGGEPARVRQGETRSGWRFVGVEAGAGEAVFKHGDRTRHLPVSR